MSNQKSNTNAVSFGSWGWFLIIICILYQMMYSAFASRWNQWIWIKSGGNAQ